MRYVLKSSPILKKSGQNIDVSVISTRMNLLNIGKAQVVTIPGEALKMIEENPGAEKE